MEKIKAFISYGHDDYADCANLIYESLNKDIEFSAWIDKRIEPGDEWNKEIENQLNKLVEDKENSWFIYVVTPYSSDTKRNNFCIKEIVGASERGIKILPIKIVQTQMPLLLGNIQWLDFTECVFDENNKDYQLRIESLKSILKRKKELQLDGIQATLYNKLEPCDYSLELKKHLLNYVERPWLLDVVKKLMDDSCSKKVMFLLGGPGTGKTAFSMWLSHGELSNCIAAWHLCQYNDKRTCSLRNAVKSMAFLLAERIKEYYDTLNISKLDHILENPANDAGTLFKALVLEPVGKIVSQDHPWIILIDALDEMDTDDARAFAELLFSYSMNLPKWLKFVVTSRKNELVSDYQNNTALMTVDLDAVNLADHSEGDVERYVKQMMGASESCVPQIVKNSGNNFLFAQLLCSTIKDNPSFDSSGLPNGINGYYSKYMSRYFNKQDFQECALPLLNLILTAYEPIDMEDLYQHLHGTNRWCGNRTVFHKVVKQFGPLLKDSDHRLLPFHKSLTDWFLSSGNNSYRVFREDGLDEMVRWGEDIIADENPDKEDLMTLHFYRYWPSYRIQMMSRSNYAAFLSVYCDLDFWKKRQKVLGVDIMLGLLFDELAMCPTWLRGKVFQHEGFFNVIYWFGFDLFNKGLYRSLKALGYNVELVPGMSDKQRLVAMRFYYINESFNEIDAHYQFLVEPYQDRCIEAMVFNLLGQTYRKIGLLKKSADYSERALGENGDCFLTSDDQIFTRLNLSRALFQLGEFQSARMWLNEAVSLYDGGDWRENFLGSDYDFAARQLERAKRYVVLETEIFSLTMNRDVCETELAWADDLYADAIRRDRYYTNHLIGKLLYLIRCGDFRQIPSLIDECKKNITCRFDEIRISLIESLYDLAFGKLDAAYQKASVQLGLLREVTAYLTQRVELVAVVHSCGHQDEHMDMIPDEMRNWYEHFMQIIGQIKRTGNCDPCAGS